MESKLLSTSFSRSRRQSMPLPLKVAKIRPNWANLPGDVLPIIAEKASTTNRQYVHLRAVCKDWQRALTPHPHHLPPQLPWLMLPHLPSDTRQRLGISDSPVSFYDIARSKTYRFQLPYMNDKYYCGSSHGWLVLEHQHRVSLFNPLTSRCIDLPSLDYPPTLLRERPIPSDQHEEHTTDQHEEHTNCIVKASLSCSPSKPGCVVVAWFLYSNWELGFCKIGDSHWTELKKQDTGRRLVDFTLYHNKLVYTVNTRKEVSVYNLQDRSVWTFPSKINFSNRVFDQINLVEGGADSHGPLIVRQINLVEGGADSHGPLIGRTLDYSGKITVHVYKWCDSKQIWRRVKDIGKRVLFINRRHSFNLQSDNFMQENGVYYDVRHSLDVNFFCVGLIRANLESGKVVPHKPMDVFSSRGGLPLWVTPSLI